VKTIGIVAVAALAASAAGRGDQRHATTDQVGRERRQAIVAALQPVVLDRYVLAFDKTAFAEPFAERGHKARGGIRRPAVDKSDQRQCPLLRTRRERPRHSRAAQQRNKFPPPHGVSLLPRLRASRG
jgi:hypothetical protein